MIILKFILCVLCVYYFTLMFKYPCLVEIDHYLFNFNFLSLNIPFFKNKLKFSLPSRISYKNFSTDKNQDIFISIPKSLYLYIDLNNVDKLKNILNQFKNKAMFKVELTTSFLIPHSSFLIPHSSFLNHQSSIKKKYI